MIETKVREFFPGNRLSARSEEFPMIENDTVRTEYIRSVGSIRWGYKGVHSINKMWVSIISVMFLLVGSGTVSAQSVGKISGKIVDAETGEPLIGCNILVVGTTLGGSTNTDGEYFILNVPPGKYDLQASILGYQKTLMRGAIVDVGRTTTADFKLSAAAVLMQEVVVQATRPDVEREKTSTSAIIRSEDVQALAGIRDVGDVLNLAADVTDGHFRGGRENEEYYTLQGMGIVNPLNNTSAFLPIMSAVEEVEVITSGFGAQYGNAQSGVVNISMKEGKPDMWRTTVETRMRGPGRKHFGPSAYDPGANPYLALLLNGNVWLTGSEDPTGTGGGYIGAMGSGLTGQYGRDTAVQLAIARTLWQMQTRRDLNLNYGKDLDYSAEVASGGPVNDFMRMFVALRSSVEWPVFPTEQPNTERQVMGNAAIDVGGSSTLRVSGGYSEENTNVFPSVNNYTGYENWLWDRITAIDYQRRTNLQLGTRFTHTFTPSTFVELKLNTLWTKRNVGSTPTPGSLPDSVALANTINWSFILPVHNGNSPDKIDYMSGDDVFRDELTRTISIDGALTSQVTTSHLLNFGVQANTYFIDVTNDLGIFSTGSIPVEHYRSTPFEGALYAQDKMEFEGMIANVGIRADMWNSASDYYTNQFKPYLSPDSIGIYHPDSAPKKKAPLLGRVQPRVGVSFPVSVNTVFHLNYGSFMQRPPFRYVVDTRVTQGFLKPVVLGNPRLEPETTNSYDIGVTQGLGEGFTLDVSGYYKGRAGSIFRFFRYLQLVGRL